MNLAAKSRVEGSKKREEWEMESGKRKRERGEARMEVDGNQLQVSSHTTTTVYSQEAWTAQAVSVSQSSHPSMANDGAVKGAGDRKPLLFFCPPFLFPSAFLPLVFPFPFFSLLLPRPFLVPPSHLRPKVGYFVDIATADWLQRTSSWHISRC